MVRKMKKFLNINFVSGIIMFFFSLLLKYVTVTSVSVKGGGAGFHSRTVPNILFVVIALSSTGLMIQGLLLGKGAEIPIDKKSRKAFGAFIIYILMFVLYAFIMPRLGYIFSTILLGVGILINYRVKKWYYYILISGLITGIYWAFRWFLHVNLPVMF